VLGELLGFLVHLNAITPGTVPALKEEALVGAYNRLQRRFHQELDGLLTRDEIRRIERIYQAHEADRRNRLLAPSVIHSDLKPAHVLFDHSSGHLSGILDWGDACLGDPDFDFACIQIFFGSEFLLMLLSLVPQVDRERILRKTPFLILIRALQDVIVSKERNEKKAVTLGLRGLRAHLGHVDAAASRATSWSGASPSKRFE
jgi:aminoglycoside phosphotransferase (APT) family kinase protein